MKKMMVLISAIFILTAGFSMAIAGPGPAPNSGDDIPDGSGLCVCFTPCDIIGLEDCVPAGSSGEGEPHRGPAPNSGDGVPDGPGW